MSAGDMRLSPWRVTVAAVVGLAVVAVAVWGGMAWKAQAQGSGVTPVFAPYVDVTATPEYAFEQAADSGAKNVVLSFVVAPRSGDCAPSWGGAYALGAASTALDLDRRISRLRHEGGDVAVSFGGQAGTELALACTTTSELESAYAAVVSRYELSTIDLDLEGSALSDSASIARRADAIAKLQKERRAAGHKLSVWLTLPVGTDGLQSDAQRVVTAMLRAGVAVAGVNAMTMDYGTELSAGKTMAAIAKGSLNAVHGQLDALYRRQGERLTSQQLWGKVGATPMIGQNDTAGEVFTLADARKLNAFATENGVGRMSMWSLNRDQSCSANYPDTSVVSDACSGVTQRGVSFASTLGRGFGGKIVDAAAAVAKPTAIPTQGATADDPATSPYPIWNDEAAYVGGSKVVWHHEVYEAKWWTQGDVPDDPTGSSQAVPWQLIGPVLPGETPAPQPTVAAGTFPTWSPSTSYTAGAHVMLNGVAYQAKWWTKGDDPSHQSGDPSSPSPWQPLTPQQVAALTADAG
ncbi:T2SS-translocated chitinase [Gryllotalpicola kribbensis]|uniref:T2SS-translocated chitinase n=1 Tax=Gryllotalpicola kribbensis TaxID=993084 RepID=A0ABP8AP56_9MICO